ncbi:MAG: sigma-70 family RNA polymerase sigma factor [Planctomycetota bacterium]
MSDEQSIDLLQRWRNGDDSAATEIFERYVNRLCALARTRLSNRMQRRVEAEDVVQSAYRSFFRRAGEHYAIEKQGDLWRLLAAITINKVRGQVEFHTAKKRGVYLEESMMADQSMIHVSPEVISEEPKPDDAAAMVEEISDVLAGLDDTQRSIIELSMQNQSVEQIAQTIQRSERTVRRTIQQVREDLENRLLRSVQQNR